MDYSVTTLDEIIESYDETKKKSTSFNEDKTTCKKQNAYILL